MSISKFKKELLKKGIKIYKDDQVRKSDVNKIMTIAMNEKRLKEVAQKAEDAFWETVAKEYPEAKTGDLGPDIVVPLVTAMKEAIKAWVRYNVPSEQHDLDD